MRCDHQVSAHLLRTVLQICRVTRHMERSGRIRTELLACGTGNLINPVVPVKWTWSEGALSRAY